MQNLMKFLDIAGELKRETRFNGAEYGLVGFDRFGVGVYCSSAAHSWRTAMIAMTFIDKFEYKLDVEKVLRMALLHDLGEAKIGNVDHSIAVKNPHFKAQQVKKENKAFAMIVGLLNDDMKKYYKSLHNAYKLQNGAEAKFVKVCKRIETILHLSKTLTSMDAEGLEMTGTYGNDVFAKRPEYQGIIIPTKETLLDEFRNCGLGHLWKPEFNVKWRQR